MLYISYYLFAAVSRHVPLNKDLQALTVRNIKFPTIMVPTKIILPKIISQNHSVLLCSISRCHTMDLCFLVAQVDDLNGKPIPFSQQQRSQLMFKLRKITQPTWNFKQNMFWFHAGYFYKFISQFPCPAVPLMLPTRDEECTGSRRPVYRTWIPRHPCS